MHRNAKRWSISSFERKMSVARPSPVRSWDSNVRAIALGDFGARERSFLGSPGRDLGFSPERARCDTVAAIRACSTASCVFFRWEESFSPRAPIGKKRGGPRAVVNGHVRPSSPGSSRGARTDPPLSRGTERMETNSCLSKTRWHVHASRGTSSCVAELKSESRSSAHRERSAPRFSVSVACTRRDYDGFGI